MTAYKKFPIVQNFAHPHCCKNPKYNDQVVEEAPHKENVWKIAGFCESCDTEYCEEIKLEKL
jgi:hypothetical protein